MFSYKINEYYNRIIIQNRFNGEGIYLYRPTIKSKRNRLPCREMPFFSGGQNKDGLFAYDKHFYILYSIKNCTNDGGKKASFFVNIHNCFLPSVGVRYNHNKGITDRPTCRKGNEHGKVSGNHCNRFFL